MVAIKILHMPLSKMRSVDVADFIKRNPAAVLLLSRRSEELSDVIQSLSDNVLSLTPAQPVADMRGQIASACFLVEGSLPTAIQTRSSGRFVRIMDRIFIPETTNAKISRVLFELIPGAYDALIHPEVNIAVSRFLFERIGVRSGKILDFGCGTGLAMVAKPIDTAIALIGVDASDGMLDVASNRGQEVTSIQNWRRFPDEIFDGALATFVLHYGVSDADFSTMRRQLKIGGRLAANLYKFGTDEARGLATRLERLGYSAVGIGSFTLDAGAGQHTYVCATRAG